MKIRKSRNFAIFESAMDSSIYATIAQKHKTSGFIRLKFKLNIKVHLNIHIWVDCMRKQQMYFVDCDLMD